MLRRDLQIRMQIHQLVDACLFALAFWLAYVLRSNPDLGDLFSLAPVEPFDKYVWMYLVLIPVSPLILEAQGFYSRPLLCSRQTTAWQLFKGCLFTALVLILALFFFRLVIARSVVIWFGFISFLLVFCKEELLRHGLRSSLGQTQYRRRFVLVGSASETSRMSAELKARSHEGVEILAELNLNETPLEKLVEMLHEFAVNGVIINAKHSFFEEVEAVIKAC